MQYPLPEIKKEGAVRRLTACRRRMDGVTHPLRRETPVASGGENVPDTAFSMIFSCKKNELSNLLKILFKSSLQLVFCVVTSKHH